MGQAGDTRGGLWIRNAACLVPQMVASILQAFSQRTCLRVSNEHAAMPRALPTCVPQQRQHLIPLQSVSFQPACEAVVRSQEHLRQGWQADRWPSM
jgi:hypothetical protein